MKKLLMVLKDIEVNKEIEFKEYLTNGRSSDLSEIVKYARDRANDVLITNGAVDFHKAMQLEEYGYRVFRGDYDSYGWLTGCIRTSKGIIVFG